MVEPIRTIDFPLSLELKPSELLVEVGAAGSETQAKRLIQQGAVELRSNREAEPIIITSNQPLEITDGMILHVGKRFWCKLKLFHYKAEIYEFTTATDERAFLESCPNLNRETIERYMQDDWGEF